MDTHSAPPVAVVAGASGFVGRSLVEALRRDGMHVRTIGRTGRHRWDDPASVLDAVEGASLVVGLSGKSVDCRYTDRNRDEILRSRVHTTSALHRAIAATPKPPAVWLNASTATIYRHEVERANTERDGVVGEGFSVDVARAWEEALFEGDLPGTRRVALRMAIVVGDGPATRVLFRIARAGCGGPQIDGPWVPHRRYRGIGPRSSGPEWSGWRRSRGAQRFSWVHIDDVVRAVRFIADHDEIEGPVNIAAPASVDNRTLMSALRRVVGAPFGLPVWRFMLEPAMWVLRTEPELVLKSRWVAPDVLERAGFVFEHTDLERTLEDAHRAVSAR